MRVCLGQSPGALIRVNGCMKPRAAARSRPTLHGIPGNSRAPAEKMGQCRESGRRSQACPKSLRHCELRRVVPFAVRSVVLPAVILAAGASTRMGSPKALLTAPSGRPFVSAIVRALAAASVTDIVVVTGAEHDRIVEAVLTDAPAVMPRFARNPDPSRGQLSSLWV